ncbi:hypothetical protein ACIPW5_37790 [Streptomyces sp. NPDC090077]|uniref:hypothetical protein n=1 Tax=Streptomyces sp. NPDC090077 TaxID=3365938 RepID=UPI003826373E
MSQQWRLMTEAKEIGILELIEIDQPWFRCAFRPGPEWNGLESLFESQASAVDASDDRMMMKTISAVRSLDLQLAPIGEGDLISPVIIQIRDGKASFRY